MISLKKTLNLTLLCITLTMVIGYTWLMEANLTSGLLLGSEIRLNRTADAWFRKQPLLATERSIINNTQSKTMSLPPSDGTPVVYDHRDYLPAIVTNHLPKNLVDGQFTVIQIDDTGLINTGYLLHLFRNSPTESELHILQRLVLADHEVERVQNFDKLMNKRVFFPSAIFFFIMILIVFLFGHLITRATKRLLHWCENLSIDSLPEKPITLPFVELHHFAVTTLTTVERESKAIAQKDQFLRFASHELRTPLAIASANTELLGKHGVSSEAQNALSRLEKSLKNMVNLTETLLWLGRGEIPLPDAEPIDLLDLISDIVKENSRLAKNNHVVVEINSIPKLHVFQPRILLMILCSNLIDNAIRYTRNGRVEIRLNENLIEITNHGEFFGSDASSGGHGLGLNLVAWVIERANWQWDFEKDDSYSSHRITLTTEIV